VFKKRVIKFVFTIVFIPLTLGTIKSFVDTFSSFNPLGHSTWPFFLGLLVYPLFQYFIFNPLGFYIFGHELTHGLFSLLFGGKIKKFQVSIRGGSIHLTKTNFLIILAPYFFPVYVFLFLLFWGGIKHFYPTVVQYHSYFLFGLGFFLGLHLVYTWYSLRTNQPDLRKAGILFSLLIVLFSNCLIIVLLLKLLFPKSISLYWFFRNIWVTQYKIWVWIIYQLKIFVHTVFK